jgi:phosphoribosylanthranilate isomerase
MTWVKICGMTNLEDALVAVDAGADAVGFVFYAKSPRCVSVDAAREIVEKLPERTEKVGVFVAGAGIEFGIDFIEVGLTGIQFYFPMDPAALPASRETHGYGAELFPQLRKFFMALPASSLIANQGQVERLVASFAQMRQMREQLRSQPGLPEGMLDKMREDIFDTYFLDSGCEQQPGGTGTTFDWERAVPAVEGLRQGGLKVVVAGGLTTDNIGEAVGILKPWGVDVASGVEVRPGKKDPEKVRAFVKAVREADRKTS